MNIRFGNSQTLKGLIVCMKTCAASQNKTLLRFTYTYVFLFWAKQTSVPLTLEKHLNMNRFVTNIYPLCKNRSPSSQQTIKKKLGMCFVLAK